jgi:iron complex outermembrane receptor protein
LHLDLASQTALVATLTRSYRAPALEELYNFGPHVGNLAFEIGNTNLDREASVGFDVSLRHRAARARGEINAFMYNIDNFVFAQSTRLQIDGLFVSPYLQGNSRFVGFDGQASVGLHEHLWANVSAGYVRARLTDSDENVPRIPPFHGRVWFDIPFGGLTVTPEVIWAATQDQVFRNETETSGYTLVNLQSSYMLARSHYGHVFTISGDNLTNELYRRHTSFIKDLAPEMGRRIRISYGIRFF